MAIDHSDEQNSANAVHFALGYEDAAVLNDFPPDIEVITHTLGHVGIRLSQLADLARVRAGDPVLWVCVDGAKPTTDLPKSPTFADGNLVLDLDLYSLVVNTELVPVTLKEFKLLEELMSKPKRIVAKQHLLEKVWGDDRSDSINTNTVETYVGQCRKRLGQYGSFLRTRKGFGYYFSECLYLVKKSNFIIH